MNWPKTRQWAPLVCTTNKALLDFPNYYINRMTLAIKHKNRTSILKPFIRGSESPRVTLSINGVKKSYFVHRLWLLTVKGPPPVGHTADHISHNPQDNTPQNLRWISIREQNLRRKPFKRKANYVETKLYPGEKIKNIPSKRSQWQISSFGRLFLNGRVRENTASRRNLYEIATIDFKCYYLHRLVAWAFLGLDLADTKQIVMHLDNNPRNNRVTNLRIGTWSENMKHHHHCFTRA
jgi:HNH endonuclease